MSTFLRTAVATFVLIGTVSAASAHSRHHHGYDYNTDIAKKIFEQVNRNAAG
jgi:hypothetical protein